MRKNSHSGGKPQPRKATAAPRLGRRRHRRVLLRVLRPRLPSRAQPLRSAAADSVVTIHTVAIPGLRSSRASPCPGEFHPSKMGAGSSRTPRSSGFSTRELGVRDKCRLVALGAGTATARSPPPLPKAAGKAPTPSSHDSRTGDAHVEAASFEFARSDHGSWCGQRRRDPAAAIRGGLQPLVGGSGRLNGMRHKSVNITR